MPPGNAAPAAAAHFSTREVQTGFLKKEATTIARGRRFGPRRKRLRTRAKLSARYRATRRISVTFRLPSREIGAVFVEALAESVRITGLGSMGLLQGVGQHARRPANRAAPVLVAEGSREDAGLGWTGESPAVCRPRAATIGVKKGEAGDRKLSGKRFQPLGPPRGMWFGGSRCPLRSLAEARAPEEGEFREFDQLSAR